MMVEAGRIELPCRVAKTQASTDISDRLFLTPHPPVGGLIEVQAVLSFPGASVGDPRW